MKAERFRDIESVADWAWHVVPAWEPLARDTLGVELIRACERVGAVLVSEGGEEGRNSDPQPAHFFPGAQTAARTAIYWIERAAARGLVPTAEGRARIATLRTAVGLQPAAAGSAPETEPTATKPPAPHNVDPFDEALGIAALSSPPWDGPNR